MIAVVESVRVLFGVETLLAADSGDDDCRSGAFNVRVAKSKSVAGKAGRSITDQKKLKQ